MDLLTPGAREVVMAASRAAKALGFTEINAEHILVGLLSTDSSPCRILAGFGLTATKVMSHLATPGTEPGAAGVNVPMSDDVKRTILVAQGHARSARQSLDVEHLTRALLSRENPRITELLAAADTSAAAVLAALDALDVAAPHQPAPSDGELVGAGASTPAAATDSPRAPSGALGTYGQDMVAAAREGLFGAVRGRARELDRIQVILSRRTKNNPVLIGEAGVGKTAVVESLALAIANGTCVEPLRGRPLVALDIAGVVAGAKARGEFEDRLKKVVSAAKAQRAILFIDEIHQIVGAGASSGSMDVANMLKEGMARGELTLIGATTLDEYRKHIESDAALERRLDTVLVQAPSVADTVDILKTVRSTFAAHHGVQYTVAALHAAAALTDRHVPDRQLPDKAIDALDEAGAAAAIAISRCAPEAHDTYASRRQVRTRLARAVSEERYEDAAELLTQDKELTAQIVEITGTDLGLVDEDRVAAVVSATAGVPLGALVTREREELENLDVTLKSRVIGQDDAVDTVVSVVRRRRVLGAERPAALLFAGPTGVGKTELATALAEVTGHTLVRFDMSEFAEKLSVSRLVGAPPGFVGYEEGGELTEAVRRNPHAVVLLDEVEKAHPGVFDLLLQALEDGHLTDGSGRVVSFKDAIVILTSNLGSASASAGPVGFSSTAPGANASVSRGKVIAAVKDHFRPELLNRIDHVVVFNALSRENLTGIVVGLLARPIAQLAERGVRVQLSDAAIDALLAAGYDPAMGARPLRRAITRMLENPLSDALLAGALTPGSIALVDAVPGAPQLVVVAEPDVEAPELAQARATSR